ncbi:hypothetical protein BGZ58_004422, partial [Dissophora ornata]
MVLAKINSNLKHIVVFGSVARVRNSVKENVPEHKAGHPRTLNQRILQHFEVALKAGSIKSVVEGHQELAQTDPSIAINKDDSTAAVESWIDCEK